VLRSIPASFDQQVVAAIDARLAKVRDNEQVAIPLAIESGSRAWGFPSPDSDYDSRFVFVRRMEDYLSPWPKRDVIETPLDGLLDVNGWDLRKALKLLLKGNAVILEWLQSPIQYGVDPWFQSSLLDLAREVADRGMIARHYFHTAQRQRQLHLSDRSKVQTKKLFYVLRPVLALRWLWMRGSAAVPPMHFQTLMAETHLPPPLEAELHVLIEDKAHAREKARRSVSAEIGAFIAREMELWEQNVRQPAPVVDSAHRARASAFMSEAVERFGARVG
jgi:predicted nucleotidyltransferase